MKSEFLCAVCGGGTATELLAVHEPDRFERACGVDSTGYRRVWMLCCGCGAATNVLPPEALSKLSAMRCSYYEADFAGTNIQAKYCKVMALPPERSDNAGRVDRVIGFCGRWFGGQVTPRVLDIGAGTGVFLARLAQETQGRWRCLALEPDPDAAEHLRGLALFPVVQAMFVGQPDLRGFNLVTLNKVLEHLADPVTMLRQIACSLSPENGLAYIEVPDVLTATVRPAQDNILGALHCHLYDPLSLCRVVQSAGMEVVHLERIHEPSGKLTTYCFATLPEVLRRRGEEAT